MKTDVTLESVGRTVVVDAKYHALSLQTSQFGKETVKSDNLYQMFAYLKNLQKHYPEGPTVEGILLYPVVGRPLDLRFRIHGHPLRVATLNLDQHWSGIKGRLLELIGPHSHGESTARWPGESTTQPLRSPVHDLATR